MSKINIIFSIVTHLIISSVLASTVMAGNQADSLTNTLYQIKVVLIQHYTENDIELMIKQANEMGATGYKIARLNFSQDMGWLLEDKSGREVFRVFFSFRQTTADSGRYLGPLISKKAKEGTDNAIFEYHSEMMSNNYKKIDRFKYDIGDGCIANLKLFKNNSNPGRTVITIECYKKNN